MCNYLRLTMGSFVFLGLTASLVAQPRGEHELLEFVRDAHRATRESIRTLACRVEFKLAMNSKNPPEIQTCSGRYWYSPDAVRGQGTEFGKEHDYLWKDSVRQAVVYKISAGKRVAAGANRAGFASRHLERCDPYSCGLLVLNTPDSIDYVPFEQLLAQSKRVDKTKRITVNGKEMIVVHLIFDRKNPDDAAWEVEIQFDPEINYLVRSTKYIGTYPKGKVWREDEVVQFKECAPGVFFPEKIVGRTGSDGKNWDSNNTTAISDIRVNQRLPDDIFRFRYPNGVYLTDSIRHVGYRVDSEGNRISPEEPLGEVPPPSIGDLNQSAPGTETEKEPQPMTRWILPISLCIALCGCFGLLLRRWRGRNKTA